MTLNSRSVQALLVVMPSTRNFLKPPSDHLSKFMVSCVRKRNASDVARGKEIAELTEFRLPYLQWSDLLRDVHVPGEHLLGAVVFRDVQFPVDFIPRYVVVIPNGQHSGSERALENGNAGKACTFLVRVLPRILPGMRKSTGCRKARTSRIRTLSC